MVLVDVSGRIVGVAHTGFWRPDVPARLPYITKKDAGFWGYVPGDLEASAADAFAILSDGISACPLTGQPLKIGLLSLPIPAPN